MTSNHSPYTIEKHRRIEVVGDKIVIACLPFSVIIGN